MNTDVFIIDGHAYSWRRICELRRQQLEAIRKARMEQLALFELRDDCRPAAECSAAGRYLEQACSADSRFERLAAARSRRRQCMPWPPAPGL